MRYLTTGALLRLHDHIIYHFGGESGVLHQGLVDAAAQRPQTIIHQTEIYKGCIIKAASLAYALITWHPFVDGNKRTAVASMSMMLDANGIHMSLAPYLVKYSLLVAREQMDEDHFVKQIYKISSPKNSFSRRWKDLRYYRIPTWELLGFARLGGRLRIYREMYAERLLDWMAAGDLPTLRKTLEDFANQPHRKESALFHFQEGDIIEISSEEEQTITRN